MGIKMSSSKILTKLMVKPLRPVNKDLLFTSKDKSQALNFKIL